MITGASDVLLSVDYGTSNTVAVVRWPDGRTRPLLFDGSPLLPSGVYRDGTGALLAGRDAAHSARLDPARFEPYPKSRVGDGTVLLGDTETPVAELVAATLRLVAAEAARAAGTAPAALTLTYPAAWAAPRRGVLHEAAALAGLGPARLVPEPVAAAAYFTTVLGHRLAPGQYLIVYDLGAGTFDVSAVQRSPDGYQVVDVDGLPSLGGLDLDAVLVRLVGAAVADTDPAAWQRLTNPVDAADRRAFRAFWDDARTAKEMLSRHGTAGLFVPLLEKDVHVSREEFEAAAGPKLAEAARLTATLIERSAIAPDQLAGIFLVGGSSRVPLAATTVHRATRVAPDAIEQPETVVAEGALRTAVAAPPPPAVTASAGDTFAGDRAPEPPVPAASDPPAPPAAFGAAAAAVATAEPARVSPAVTAEAYPDGRVRWPSWRYAVVAVALALALTSLEWRAPLPSWFVDVAGLGGVVSLATAAAVRWVRPWLRWEPASGMVPRGRLIAGAVLLSLFGATGALATGLLLPSLRHGIPPWAADPVSAVIWLVSVPVAVGAVAVVHRAVADLPPGGPVPSRLPDWSCLGWPLLAGTILAPANVAGADIPFAVGLGLVLVVTALATVVLVRRLAGGAAAPRSWGTAIAGAVLLVVFGTAAALWAGELASELLIGWWAGWSAVLRVAVTVPATAGATWLLRYGAAPTAGARKP